MSTAVKVLIGVGVISIILACTSWIALEFLYEPGKFKCGAEEVGLFTLGLILTLSLLAIVTSVIMLVCNMVWRWW